MGVRLAGQAFGAVDFSSFAESIIPDTDSAYDLGDATHYWATVYADKIEVGAGSAGDPSVRVGGQDNGLIRPAPNTLAVIAGGAYQAKFAGGKIQLEAGSSSSPSCIGGADGDTGLSWPGSNVLQFSTGGALGMFLDASQNLELSADLILQDSAKVILDGGVGAAYMQYVDASEQFYVFSTSATLINVAYGAAAGQTGLQVTSFLGLRRFEYGAADSAGAGYRTVRIAN